MILGLLVVSAGFDLVKFGVGRWSVALASLNDLVHVAFAGWWFWLLLNDSLLNQAFFDAIGFPDAADLVARGIAIGVVGVNGWSAIEGLVKARGCEPRSGGSPDVPGW